MEIAKGIKATDYKKLDLSDYKNPDWDLAFGYLSQRLEDRYIEPAEVLRNAEQSLSPSKKKYGFTILAIDCLLCETLQCFYEGRIVSNGSKAVFARFLMQRTNFSPFFTSKSEAEDFYTNFRCGILHQAQTQGKTKIYAVGSLISKHDGYTIVNRERFHEYVKKEKQIYLDLLKARANTKLLRYFKTKMDAIAQ